MILRNRFKIMSCVVDNFSKITRNYAAPKKLPVEWIRPEKVSCISPEKSGDLGLSFNLTPNDPIDEFNKSSELEKASPLVKKIYSVEFNRRKDLIKLQKDEAIKLVQRHANDRGSREANVAQMTVEILQLQERQFSDEFKRDKKTKVFLKEMIEKRKKMLALIRTQDYACFEYLLENLNLKFHPYLEEEPPIHRKSCTKRLLQKHCDELVQKKLNAYKKELESQMKDFYREKAEKLEFIRNEEIDCGVEPTITQEDIETAKQKAAQYA